MTAVTLKVWVSKQQPKQMLQLEIKQANLSADKQMVDAQTTTVHTNVLIM